MKKLLIVGSMAVLAGCVSIPPAQMPITTEQREFVYEYAVQGKTQSDLFKAARSHFALAYGNSKEVSRLEDEAQGTIIGKAIVPWNLSTDGLIITSMPCASYYNVIFVAKEGRARMQLSLLEGAALPLSCGWTLPPKRDYPQIVTHFKNAADSLGSALDNKSALDKLKNF